VVGECLKSEAHLVGVPTYQVGEGELIWGQDRSDMVLDIMCGWKVPPIQLPKENLPKSAL
jgi:hypothetical protein